MQEVPGNLRWDPNDILELALKGAFLRVGGDRLTRRTLNGAIQSWQNPGDENIIYHTGTRLTGSPENVVLALRYAGVSDEDFK